MVQSSSRISLELKVGLFLLFSAGLLVALVLVLGQVRFAPMVEMSVDFTASGGIRDGAKVKVAGVPGGRVVGVEFLDGSERDRRGNALWVRVKLEIEGEKAAAVTESARFFVSAEGLLGEKYIEITPGRPDDERLGDGAMVVGEPVLELQLVTGQAMELMDAMREAVESGGGSVADVFRDAREIVARTNRVLEVLEQQVPVLSADARSSLEAARKSLTGLDELTARAAGLLDGPDGIEEGMRSASRTIQSMEESVPRLAEGAEALMADGRALTAQSSDLLASAQLDVDRLADEGMLALRDVRRVAGQFGTLAARIGDVHLPRLLAAGDALVATASGLAARAESLISGAESALAGIRAIISGLQRGEGTIGALLTDRELYDDVRELVLDLKRNPWKVLWKP